MTHELPTKAIRAQLRGRCRSDAGLGRPRTALRRARRRPARARDEPGTSRGGDCGAFRRHAPDDPVHQQRETCGDGLPPARPGRSGRSVPRHRPPRRRHRPATRREWTWMRPVRL